MTPNTTFASTPAPSTASDSARSALFEPELEFLQPGGQVPVEGLAVEDHAVGVCISPLTGESEPGVPMPMPRPGGTAGGGDQAGNRREGARIVALWGGATCRRR